MNIHMFKTIASIATMVRRAERQNAVILLQPEVTSILGGIAIDTCLFLNQKSCSYSPESIQSSQSDICLRLSDVTVSFHSSQCHLSQVKCSRHLTNRRPCLSRAWEMHSQKSKERKKKVNDH